MSASVPISLTTAQNKLFDLKKKYYLPPLLYLTIVKNIKGPIKDEDDFNMKRDRAIADFRKTSLYSIYDEIFDTTIKDNITHFNLKYVFNIFNSYKNEDADKKTLEYIKTNITGENSNTDDNIEEAYEIFKEMIECDKM
jgi:hypothetical protein